MFHLMLGWRCATDAVRWSSLIRWVVISVDSHLDGVIVEIIIVSRKPR